LTFHLLEPLSPEKSGTRDSKMTIQLKIDGMHCSGCVNAVRRVLEASQSVTAVSVDLNAGRAAVEASAGVDPLGLVAALEDAGYDARIEA
jgi:Cu+-exporting ATPase